jgi:thioredoxin-related protein
MPHVRFVHFGLAALGLVFSAGAFARADEPAKEEVADKEAAAKVEAAWVKVWDEAKAKAKKENKDLLIDFTGSDWCPPCKRMHEEVFSQVEFVDAATKEFVLVYLDYPRYEEHKKLVVDAAANERVRELYGVNSFPTVILTNSDGLPYVRTGGYAPGGPSAFLQALDGFKPSRDTFKTFQAKGKLDAAAFKAGFDLLVAGEFLGYPDYAWMLDHAEKQDADGSKGLKKAVEGERARQRSAVEEKALLKIANEATAETRMEKIHGFLKTSKDLRGVLLWKASMAVANWLLEKKDFDEAKRMFQLPLRDPEIASDEGAKQGIAEALKQVDEVANPKPPEPEAPKPEETKPGTAPK